MQGTGCKRSRNDIGFFFMWCFYVKYCFTYSYKNCSVLGVHYRLTWSTLKDTALYPI